MPHIENNNLSWNLEVTKRENFSPIGVGPRTGFCTQSLKSVVGRHWTKNQSRWLSHNETVRPLPYPLPPYRPQAYHSRTDFPGRSYVRAFYAIWNGGGGEIKCISYCTHVCDIRGVRGQGWTRINLHGRSTGRPSRAHIWTSRLDRSYKDTRLEKALGNDILIVTEFRSTEIVRDRPVSRSLTSVFFFFLKKFLI